MKQAQKHELDNLLSVLTRIESKKDLERLFEDLFTIREINEIAQRLTVAIMLRAGKSYSTIIKKTGASATTVARVSKCLAHGSGGYARAFKALEAEWAENPQGAFRSKELL